MNKVRTKKQNMRGAADLTIFKIDAERADKFIYCRACRAKTIAFTKWAAALIFRCGAPEIEHLLNSGSLHRNADAALCGGALAAHFGRDVRFVED